MPTVYVLEDTDGEEWDLGATCYVPKRAFGRPEDLARFRALARGGGAYSQPPAPPPM
jgi:hypothetical protein